MPGQDHNHAGYTVETDDHILLVDPWLEGTAFNDGWGLLDTTTSNAALAQRLKAQGKPVTIWYSHEHSDHFSISFLKALKHASLQGVRIAYQQTLDHRVANHLRKMDWSVTELRPGEALSIGQAMSLRVWPFYDSGDSFSLLTADGRTILNLNDCAVDTDEKANHVRASLGEHGGQVDVLLTQFGYANWIGNDADLALRQKAAVEKIQRVALQVKSLNPRTIVPFASFVRFCHEENAYMNDAQNTIDTLVDATLVAPFRDRIHVMKPGDRWDPALDATSAQAHDASEQARMHWRALTNADAAPLLRQRSQVPLADLKVSADKFRSAISRNLAWTNRLMERLGVIRPVTLHVTDLNERLEMSYRTGLRPSAEPIAHFSCSSEVLEFMLKNDFGFNTTLVNGRFRTNDMAGYSRAWRFFILQDLKKMGLSVSTPWTTLRVVARNVKKFVVRKVS